MISELRWDSDFFGRKIGRLAAVPSGEDLKRTLAEASAKGYRYLTCRVRADQIAEVQRLEGHGFYMTDTGITWKRETAEVEEPSSLARKGTVGDMETMGKIAMGLFKEGRFYHDPFFTSEEAASLYRVWAENLLAGLADKVFLVGEAGFVACKIVADHGDIPLIGVVPAQQAKGIGTALVLNALKWFSRKKVDEVTVRTQSGNIKAIRFYEHLGFTVKETDITMGKIFGFQHLRGE
jgi:dTDP-4-amino-4,6-dideoxy-D-galactose acyltransferase